MILRPRTIAFVIAMSIALVAIGCDQSSDSSSGQKEQNFGRLVEVTLENESGTDRLLLAIPIQYLRVAGSFRGGKRKYIRIETRVPGLEPAKSNIVPRGEPGSEIYERDIKILRSGLIIVLQGELHRKNWFANTRQSMDSGEIGSFEKVGSTDFGLIHYVRAKCPRDRPLGTHSVIDDCERLDDSDYYLTHPSHESTAQIQCMPVEYGGCSIRTGYRGRRLNLSIRGQELYRWDEFLMAARTLLDRFAKSSQ